MFSKFLKFFAVKEDDTLNYMNSDAIIKPQATNPQSPFNQNDEDEFFRRLEEEDRMFENLKIQQERQDTSIEQDSRESVLEKMRQCMKEKDWNPKHHPKILLAIALFIIALAITAVALHETPNPLIGKWQPQKKTNIFVPTGDIEFQKEQFYANGGSVPVKYTIENDYVEVIDLNTKIRIPFYIKDDKMIECTILGVKTVYKKVNK